MKRFLWSRPFLCLCALILGIIGTLIAYSLVPERYEIEGPLPHTVAAGTPEFRDTMNGMTGSTVLGGNRVTTLINGDEIFPAMLEAIETARTSIAFETYVYWSGEIAERFANAIAERARAGIEVRVLLDWQGSVPMEAHLIETMTEAGAHVVRFRPIHWYTLDRVNNRTHRKLLVVDGRIAFTGGVGIADEWLGDARNPDEFRETHYRVLGPAAAEFQNAFADNWLEGTGEALIGPTWYPPIEDEGPLAAHLVASNVGERQAMHLMNMIALASAQNHIRIGTPYFVPDDNMMAQLLDARQRGVEITVLVPGQYSNKPVVRAGSRHFWGDLLEAGIRFFEYEPTMYHAKVLIVDEAWTSIGSANFDERSFRLNDEANLNVFDRDFAFEQIAIFEDDLTVSREVTLDMWKNRPLRDKLSDWLFSHLRVQL